MQILWISVAIIGSYLIGAIPFGYIIPKVFKGIDIREHGSKNVGSTNVLRVLGKRYGIPTFLLDCFKGALPIIVIRYMIGDPELYLIFDTYDISILYGSFAAIGHIKSIYIGFKGGKAVATGVGAVIAINPIIGLSGIAIFFIVAFSTKYVSIGSVAASFSVAVLLWVGILFQSLWIEVPGLEVTYESQIINLVAISIIVLLIIYMHKKNFIRLLNGTENKIGQKKTTTKNK
jgi:glycerol-3-phosphate acyltransferase PlsY